MNIYDRFHLNPFTISRQEKQMLTDGRTTKNTIHLPPIVGL